MSEHKLATKSPDKKIRKAGISNLFDEAPLFAGLDDFVLVTAEKKTTVTSSPVEKKQLKNITVNKPLKNTKKAEPPTQKSPREFKTPPVDPNAVLLSVSEMCNLLKISRATLVRMDKSGKLPGRIKLGGSVRFHRETVEIWLKNLITPTPAT